MVEPSVPDARGSIAKDARRNDRAERFIDVVSHMMFTALSTGAIFGAASYMALVMFGR